MKKSLILIFPCLIISTLFSSTCNAGGDIQSWCAVAGGGSAESCVSTIESSPRTDLKKTPLGSALILLEAAMTGVRTTVNFIHETMDAVQYDDIQLRFADCLRAYNFIIRHQIKIDFDLADLKTPEGRAKAVDSLNEAELEVTYDCGWRILDDGHAGLPVVTELWYRVQNFSRTVSGAAGIINSVR